MPSTTRTFIALAIPPALESQLSRLQQKLAAQIAGVRWTSTLPFHLTLAFLGDVNDTDLHALCKTVEQAASPFPPLEFRLRGIGAFPGAARPRVIWAGLDVVHGSELEQLRKAIVTGVTRIGYRPDARFSPHVTLGRFKQDRREPKPPDLTRLADDFREWSGGSFTAREVTTFSSSLSPEGPPYAPLARASLSGKKSGPAP